MAVSLAMVALLHAGVTAAALAGEDGDLDRIPEPVDLPPALPAGLPTGLPPGLPAPSPAPPGPPAAPLVTVGAPLRRAPRVRFYLEDALTLGIRREPVVPFPPPPPYRWQNRTSGDLTAEWLAVPSLKLVLSDRVDLIEQENEAWWSRHTARNELREAYASWQPGARIYLEVGRINVRNGVALGFNPIDFFRPRTLVGQASQDPSVLSRNRFGTLMVRAQAIGDRGAVSLLYAPGLFGASPIASDALGVDPRFEATNAAHRMLATASTNAGDLSAQVLVYLERRRSKMGLALTRPLGSSVVAYGEWTLDHEANLLSRAMDYGKQTGSLPAALPPPIPVDPSPAWRHDVAAGASWTVGTRLTLNLEYHLHQGALSGADWARWFAAGRTNPSLAPELWYLRGYAADQLEPASQHNAFVRLAWPNVAIDDLEIDGFAFVNLRDGSTLSQVAASYAMSDRWTFTLSISANLGTASSERGSLPPAARAIAELARYF